MITPSIMRCPPFNDTIIDWPSILGNTSTYSRCPEYLGAPNSARAHRFCHWSGNWVDDKGQPVNDSRYSFTNFSECFRDSLTKHFSSNNTDTLEILFKYVNYVVIIGLTIGIVTLSAAILILQKYRHLRNHRTRIHKQLFIALLLEELIQMSMYAEIISSKPKEIINIEEKGDFDPFKNVMWNIRISLYEYLITSVFLWMLVEGIHIHNIIAVNVFHSRYRFNCYLFLGWVIPIPITITWIILMQSEYGFTIKWLMFHSRGIYWTLNAFRLACILINICFLINVIRVLILKMRAHNSPEVSQVKRAIKAAVLLLPLLGVINFLQIMKAGFGTLWYLVLSSLQGLLPSWQGFLVSMIYCLINKDVLQAVHNSYMRYKTRKYINLGVRINVTNLSSKTQGPSNTRSINSTLVYHTDTKIISEDV